MSHSNAHLKNNKYNAARLMLATVVAVYLIDIILGAAYDTVFLFPCSIPLTLSADAFTDNGYLSLAIILLYIIPYAICLLMSHKHRNWITAAATLYAVDIIWLVISIFIQASSITSGFVGYLDLVLYTLVVCGMEAAVLFFLVRGVISTYRTS